MRFSEIYVLLIFLALLPRTFQSRILSFQQSSMSRCVDVTHLICCYNFTSDDEKKKHSKGKKCREKGASKLRKCFSFERHSARKSSQVIGIDF